jgi:hypothetical protein
MNDQISQMVPDPWQSLFHLLTIPLAWIPDMQQALIGFVLSPTTGWPASITSCCYFQRSYGSALSGART